MKLERSSGVLLHITSLPGRYGIGTVGEEAYRFADMLVRGGFSYWQILPFGPVSAAQSYSPYASPSTFAGNYLHICPDKLKEEDWFRGKIKGLKLKDPSFVEYSRVARHKLTILEEASADFFSHADESLIARFEEFCGNSSFWLDDYSLFTSLSEHFNNGNWLTWENDISTREPAAVERYRDKFRDRIRFHKFVQFIFFKQWHELKDYCNGLGISIIGDIPIYVVMDGADSWNHREIFQVDEKTGKPDAVSGVPPDYFSETGQRWGNPLYRWFQGEGINRKTLDWWISRISHLGTMVDIIRIDHFRGFEGYWSIPAGEKTAIKGKWVKGPGLGFFRQLREGIGELNLIAEDLGVITPEVEELRDSLGLPGMKILQFAFDFNNRNSYLPHNIQKSNFILYTGTHDNNTTNGWFYGSETDKEKREYIPEYLGSDNYSDFHLQLIRAAYRSTADLVIVPVQDILGFGEKFRMNIPGTTRGNWIWKLKPEDLTDSDMEKMRRMGEIYRRLPEKKRSDEEK